MTFHNGIVGNFCRKSTIDTPDVGLRKGIKITRAIYLLIRDMEYHNITYEAPQFKNFLRQNYNNTARRGLGDLNQKTHSRYFGNLKYGVIFGR